MAMVITLCNSPPFKLLFLMHLVFFVDPVFAEPIVDAPAGRFQGKQIHDYNGETFLAFRGILYAKPPVGDLRFEKPQPLEKLESTFDASKPAVECPTPSLPIFKHYDSGDEDCLFLNVYTKRLYSTGAKKKVVVFIHGGGFVVGSSIPYLPGTFVNAHDVVFVTINYRLGILGFLSTEDEASPGNYGLWDMILALKWVRDNIEAFGGDSKDVTLSGESAGGSAVSYLTLAPPAQNLFTKVYAQSGSATSMFGRATRARITALKLALSLGCSEGGEEKNTGLEESKAVIACLKKLPFTEFTKFTAFSLDESKFVPRVDGELVPKDPLQLLRDTEYLRSIGFFDKAHLVGLDNNEASIMETHLKYNEFMLVNTTGATGTDALKLVKSLHDSAWLFYISTRLNNPQPSTSLLKTVESWYERRFGSTALTELMSDLSFLMPALDHIEATAKDEACKSWLLYFNYYPQILKGRLRGMPHSFELLYWFDFPLKLTKVFVSDPGIEEMGEEDLQLKQSFSALIAAFVKTGNLNVALNEHIPGSMPVFDARQRSFIEFCPSPSLDFNLESAKREFWAHLSSAGFS